MLSSDDCSRDDQINGISEVDWFMNKLSGSRVIKTLNITSGRNGKIRSMEDILLHPQPIRAAEMNLEQTLPPRDEYGGDSATEFSSSSAFSKLHDFHKCESEKEKAEFENPPLSADGVTDIETMTLKEMHYFLKKAAQKPSKGDRCLGSSSLTFPSDANVSSVGQVSCLPVNDVFLSTENCTPVTVLELQLDDSSADSANDFSNNSGTGSPHDNLESFFREGHHPPVEGYFEGLKSEENAETVIQDDEWTLGMWQSYHKQHSRRKHSKQCINLRSRKTSEKIQKQISSGPNSCSLNAASSIAACQSESPPESPAIPSICSPKLRGDYGTQGSPNGSADDVGDDKLDKMQDVRNDGDGPCMDEEVEKGPDVQENSSSTCGASRSCAVVRLILEDESDGGPPIVPSPKKVQEKKIEIGPWQVKSCSNAPTPTSFKATGSNTKIYSSDEHEMIDVSDHETTGASILGRGSGDIVSIDGEGRPGNVGAGRISNRLGSDGIDVSEHSGLLSRFSSKEKQIYDRAKNLPSRRERIVQDADRRVQHSCKTVGSDDSLKLTDALTEGDVGSAEVPASLLAMETLDDEDDQEHALHQPAKLPCKRRAISPLSREKLLHASNFSGSGFSELENQLSLRESKTIFKGYIGQDNFNREWTELSDGKRGFSAGSINESSSPPARLGERGEALVGSPCHNKDPSHHWQNPCPASKPFLSKVSLVSPFVPTGSPQHAAAHAQKLSLVMNNSPSPPTLQTNKVAVLDSGTPPPGFSPSVPSKGILRSNSQTCQGACRCEECVSLRSRADRASEFSQRQMQDIEGLAVKLLKELSNMRTIVQDKILQGSRSQSPRSGQSLEQVKKATSNALETEETAKKWLVRMARDCNRYCKIMRMQQRRLSFADESGGQLCHVKVFHSDTNSSPCISTPELSVESPISSEETILSIEERERKHNDK